MIQERKEAEKMTQLELERIRKESEQRRHHGYWLGDRPNFPSNTNTLSSRRATADASVSVWCDQTIINLKSVNNLLIDKT